MKRTAILLVLGALAANVAFAGLAAVFDYPDVLAAPAVQVMADFHHHQAAVSALFLLLALGAGLLAPVAAGLAPLTGRLALRVGVAAAAVQVVGLLRWPLVVPFVTDPETFRTLGTVLGTVVGETAGYLLTALWTVLVAGAVGGRLLRVWGLAAAALVASGVLVPFGVPGADLANFGGYVLWSLWLVGLAVVLWRSTPSVTVASQGRAVRAGG
ncbi:DUF4386 domain-containing protein [Planomonospora venezuelensis]|uniref:DUF4386 family protein n=1 Tax=Planomonospora venezuelensis TaxID=1999 RepID=A0A841D7I7_PLAVE|nr:DUF4386 domain-containing protein [Planomonospora venezuelensis]MBB5964125.1 hypothetical protein [Planomonospora venezuelensis]GIN01808.1 hypothetical protein Pve01_34660 [Planomonospora venezuelensis]